MTDSHMVGGPRDSSSGASTFKQAVYFLAILVAVAVLYVVSAFLGSEDESLIRIAWATIGLTGLIILFGLVRRRIQRQSLDDVLRSRRNPDRSNP